MKQEKNLELTEEIDRDEGLQSQRKLLTATSLILLALTFSGAKIEEANTFIFKLEFENQNGIGALLVTAVAFLLVRYFSYARPYHYKLFRLWSDRMLRSSYFYSVHPYEQEVAGLVVDRVPKEIDMEAIQYESGSFSFSYKCSPPFSRKFSYDWSDDHNYYTMDASVGWKSYFKVLLYELKYQVEGILAHRENLDLLAPYIIGLLAVSSYFFNDQLQAFLSLIANN